MVAITLVLRKLLRVFRILSVSDVKRAIINSFARRRDLQSAVLPKKYAVYPFPVMARYGPGWLNCSNGNGGEK